MQALKPESQTRWYLEAGTLEVTSHEGGALRNEISALIRRDTCDIISVPMAICKPERGLSLDKEFSGILTLDFPAFSLCFSGS